MISQRNMIKWTIVISILILFYIAYEHSTLRPNSNYDYAKPLLINVPLVEIDASGRFKYILVRVSDMLHNESRTVVRGFNRFEYHAQICNDTRKRLSTLGFNIVCLSGGRIEHFPDLKQIKVYGYSKTFGMANHTLTKSLLLTKYPDYDIETSNLGY